MLDEIRHAIVAGELPHRRLARALAALSTNDEAYYEDALSQGWRYWNFRTTRNYWESWRLGDLGTMAESDGPISMRAAYEALALAGIEVAAPLRCFASELRCVVCTNADAAPWCRHDAAQIVAVDAMPITVDDCAIFGADPEGVSRAEVVARALRGRPTAIVVWRTMPPVKLAHSLTEAHVAEQAPLLDLGYALDPFAYWDDGIALVAPDLSDA